ncbi:hypothetical protein LTR37_012122 [Vermiconidia calcicola]|uniref:Uncharacterized protein n=1 Tax=Vermiconidia calcicola TaxID=1690605 RepID=A0ACC3N054_9PEZI|nr:hypothetical protein LTR37_012122 [Vermiconidia calcicola]
MSGLLRGLLDTEPNYQKLALEVFEDATFQIIKGTGSLHMLYKAASGSLVLPSWVSDFTLSAPFAPSPMDLVIGSDQPDAYDETPRKGQLRVMGAPLAEVVSVSEIPEDLTIKAGKILRDYINQRDGICTIDLSLAVAALAQSESLLSLGNGWEAWSPSWRPAIGDIICHFETLQHPLCIRRSAYDTQVAYSLVGVCFIVHPDMRTPWMEISDIPGLGLCPQGEAARANFEPILLV